MNRYDIVSILQKECIVISPATIHNIFVRNGLNKLSRMNKKEQDKQLKLMKIIMIKAGELLNIDLYELSKGITIHNNNRSYYLLGLVDYYSRIAWVEVLKDKKSLNVMFAALKSFNLLLRLYGIESEADNIDDLKEELLGLLQ